MGKGIGKSYKHLVELMLDKSIKKENMKLADVTLEEFKRETRLNKMFSNLKGWTVNTDELKEVIKV